MLDFRKVLDEALERIRAKEPDYRTPEPRTIDYVSKVPACLSNHYHLADLYKVKLLCSVYSELSAAQGSKDYSTYMTHTKYAYQIATKFYSLYPEKAQAIKDLAFEKARTAVYATKTMDQLKNTGDLLELISSTSTAATQDTIGYMLDD